MRGEEREADWSRLNRKSFDYAILALILIYGGAFAILVFAQFELRRCEFTFHTILVLGQGNANLG